MPRHEAIVFWVRVKHGLDKSGVIVNNKNMIMINYASRIRTLIGGGGASTG